MLNACSPDAPAALKSGGKLKKEALERSGPLGQVLGGTDREEMEIPF